jgi:CotH kinase protein/Lamin Tail Domain/Secretion system C-terminal sorting domain
MKKSLLLLTAIIAFTVIQAQNTFYDFNTIQKIQIYFAFTNWSYRLDTLSAGSDGWLPADSVIINGVTFSNVGVKYKGNSTNNPNNKKNPFHISLDEFIPGQDYQGYTDVKLNNGAFDPSIAREITSYKILSRYMDAPKANYATVYVNNVWRGIYTNVESINKKFIGEKYYSKSGAFFKCNPKLYTIANLPNLVPNGWDTVIAYPNRYEIKSTIGWTEFIQFQQNLVAGNASIKTELDIDKTLWMHAFNNVLVNLDSYTGSFAQNYYMYKDLNGLWLPTVWDLNMCFASFTSLGNGNNLSVAGLKQLPLMVQDTNNMRPLISKIITNPTYKKMYIAHCKTIAKECMAGNDYYNIAASAQNVIKDSVLLDTNQFYTYAKFIANLDTATITNGTNSKIGIKQLMAARSIFLNTTPEFNYPSPIITAITTIPISVPINTSVTITANIANADSVYLGYREVASVPFTRTKMYDDGAHNDGANGDGIYGASFMATSGKMDYYIYASNTNVGIFSPERAEHEFHTLLPSITNVPAGSIVINEIMPSNKITIADANGQFDDYIELYNNTNTSINLSGLYLSDDKNNLSKWAFPVGTTLAANAYTLVWADQDSYQQGLHASFKLSSGAETLYLSFANGSIIDSVAYTAAAADRAIGRCANGTGPFTINWAASPNKINNCAVGIYENLQTISIQVYPNPATDKIQIATSLPISNIELYTAFGAKVWSVRNNHLDVVTIPTTGFASGLYFLKLNQFQVIKVRID